MNNLNLVCPDCGYIPEKNKSKSNESWEVFDMKCPECGSNLIVNLDEDDIEETEIIEEKTEPEIIEEEQSLTIQNETALVETSISKDFKEDFSYARKNIKDIIDIGMTATNNLANLANQTESARVYEALNSLLDVMGKNNLALLDIDNKFNDLIEGNNDSEGEDLKGVKNLTQNNIIFNGTTTELQRLIEDKLKGK